MTGVGVPAATASDTGIKSLAQNDTAGVTTSREGVEHLSVRIGVQDFALDIMQVREIRGWVASTPLPHAPAHIRGMINLRGVVMPIVDLAERLGLPTKAPDGASVVVVVELDNWVVGLLVEAVNDIVTVTDAMRQATPRTRNADSAGVIASVVMLDDRIVSILSLAAILPACAEAVGLAA